MKNHSGFTGYSIASVYPDMGSRVTDTMRTAVDPEEQERMSGIEPEKKIQPAVNPQHKTHMWIFVAVAVGLVLLFSRS